MSAFSQINNMMFFDHDVMQRSTQHTDKTKVSWGLVKTENACGCTFHKKSTNIISRASFCNFCNFFYSFQQLPKYP